MITGLGITNEFATYGAWAPFTEVNPGPFQGQQVYFDTNQNEYAVGTGPITTLGVNPSTNPLIGYNGAPAGYISPAPAASAGALVSPVPNSVATPTSSPSGLDFSAELATLETLLTGSVVAGVPNWALAGGLLGLVLFFGGKNGR